MKPGLSLSLDVIRFAAAMVVFVVHFASQKFSGDALSPIWAAPFANDAVMVFFVLSGFVIAYVVSERENTPHRYFRARIVRLSSVILPMLLLVPVLDWIGHQIDSALYDGWHDYSDPMLMVLSALTFTHESWWFSVSYFSNKPYWSIAYEFWYYAAFGVLCFLDGYKRVCALAAVLAIAGPKIFLLFPVWLMGVAVWHICSRYRMPAVVAAICLVGTVGAYVFWISSGTHLAMQETGNDILGDLGVPTRTLRWSEPWLAHYVFGIMVSVVFISIHSLSRYFEMLLSPIQGVIRWAAGTTFTVYLLHHPVTHLAATAVPGEPTDPVRLTIVFAITLAALFAIAECTERRKQAFGRAYDYLVARLMTPLRFVKAR